MSLPRGRFITIEGPEGGGKSTQAAQLVARLERAGHRVLRTREPGGTPAGEAIRKLLQHDAAGETLVTEAELLLFEASRAQLVRQVILPALEAGTYVVCDRFADSTTAYQGYARGEPIEALLAINAYAIAEAVPDLTLLIDVDVETGFARLRDRYGHAEGHDRFERAGRAFHERVRRGYLALAEREPERFAVVDGRGGVDEVGEQLWRIVTERLSLRAGDGGHP